MKYYIGLSLSSSSAIDTGVAVIEENGSLILVDKLYKMNDIIFFFENFSSLKNSEICASLVPDKTMLVGKWRVLSKPYQLVSNNPHFHNRDNWTQRFTARGSEFFRSIIEEGIPLTRFEIYLTRQSLHLNSCYKERSPADCKFLQQTLTNEWGLGLPQNMMPMAQLEAIIGAILAKENSKNPANIKQIAEFKGQKVIDVIQNPNITRILN